MLPSDLKSFQAHPAGMNLLTDGEATFLLAVVLALAFLADRLGFLA